MLGDIEGFIFFIPFFYLTIYLVMYFIMKKHS